MLKRLIVGFVAMPLIAGSAIAADLGGGQSNKDEAPAHQQEPYTWTGFHIGGHGGFSWNDAMANATGSSSQNFDCIDENLDGEFDTSSAQECDLTDDDTSNRNGTIVTLGDSFDVTNSFDLNSGVLGLHGGYRWQSGPWVFGVVGDWSKRWADDEASNTNTLFDGSLAEQNFDVSTRVKSDYLASVRAEVGYAVNRWLFTGSAGVGFTEYDIAVNVTDDDGDTDTITGGGNTKGLVLGAGVDYMLAKNFIVGIKGLHYFTGETFDLSSGSVTRTFDIDDTTVVRAEAGFKF